MSSSVSASQLSKGSKASWNFPQCNRASCSCAILWATYMLPGHGHTGHHQSCICTSATCPDQFTAKTALLGPRSHSVRKDINEGAMLASWDVSPDCICMPSSPLVFMTSPILSRIAAGYSCLSLPSPCCLLASLKMYGGHSASENPVSADLTIHRYRGDPLYVVSGGSQQPPLLGHTKQVRPL